MNDLFLCLLIYIFVHFDSFIYFPINSAKKRKKKKERKRKSGGGGRKECLLHRGIKLIGINLIKNDKLVDPSLENFHLF